MVINITIIIGRDLLIKTSEQSAQGITPEQHRQSHGRNQAPGRIQPMGNSTGPAAGRQENNRLAASVVSSPCGHSPPNTSKHGDFRGLRQERSRQAP